MSSIVVALIILSYFGLLLLISLIVGGKSDKQTFYTGNRKSPWFLVAIGMIGSSLSGVTFISVPGWVADTQFGYMQTVFGYIVGYIFIALVLLPLYYEHNFTSIYTYLRDRYGNQAHKTGAMLFLLSRFIGSTLRLMLAAGVIQFAIGDPLGIPFYITAFLCVALIFTYTFKNGIRTVIFTDVLQTVFMIGAVVLTIGFIKNYFQWDFSQMFSAIVSDSNSQIFHFNGQGGNVFWKQFLGGVFIAIAMTGLDQDMMQKNLSISNVRDAQRNIYIQMGLFIVVNLIFLSMGLLLYQYADAMAIGLPEKSDLLFPLIALNHTTEWLGVIFLIGLTAAAYSSADSALTALTTSFCVDFLGFERKKETNLKQRRMVHLAFSFLTFITMVIFYGFNNEAIIKNIFTAAGFTYGPLLGLFLVGIFTKMKFPDKSIIFISATSITLTALYYFCMPLFIDGFKPGFELILVNGGLTSLLLYAFSKLNNKKIII